MDIYEIAIDIDGHENLITKLKDSLIPEQLTDLPYEEVYPVGNKFYFATDKKTSSELSKAVRDAFEKYKEVVAEVEWLLSLRFRRVSSDTIEIRSGSLSDNNAIEEKKK